MKKHGVIQKAFITVLIVSISAFTFAGCGKKASDSSSNSNNVPRFNAAQMQQTMKNNLAALVKAGTINQSQSDKILAALTANTAKFSSAGGKRSGSGQWKGQNSGQKSQQNNSQGGSQARTRSNPLSKLVTDKVITQGQADAVMQKVRGNFGGRQNNNSNSNSSNSSSSGT